MKNIFSRTKFVKINEETANSIGNTGNSAPEIVQGWNTSVVGSLTNLVVGGTARGLQAIYKWGRRGWMTKSLLSRLNKEYLKGLIFYADEKGIDLATGMAASGTTSAQNVNSDNQEGEKKVQDKSQTGIEEVKKLLAGIDTLEEFNVTPEIQEWRDLLKNKELTALTPIENTIKQKQMQIDATTGQDKKKHQTAMLELIKKKKAIVADVEQLRTINSLLDKKYIELGGVEGVQKTTIEKTKKELGLTKMEKLLPENWLPTQQFSPSNFKFVDYPKFKEYKNVIIPNSNKIAIGDKFTYFTGKKLNNDAVEVGGKLTNVIVKYNSKPDVKSYKIDTKDGVRISVGEENKKGSLFTVSPIKLLPKSTPKFADTLSKLEKFVETYGKAYEKMDDDNKQNLMNVYQAYLVIKEMRKFYSNKISKEKADAVSESLLELKVTSTKDALLNPSASEEGGDLKGGAEGDLPLMSLLTNKDKEKLKTPDKLEPLKVSNINYGNVSRTINDTEGLDKVGVSNQVNKYNLEVIKLLSSEVFETDKQKKNWAKKVNKVNGFWTDLMDVEKVNVLSDLKFSSDVKKEKITQQKNSMNGVYDLSSLSTLLIGDKLKFSDLREGTKTILMIQYGGISFILSTTHFSSKVTGYPMLVLGSMRLNEENTLVNNMQAFENTFQSVNGIVKIDDKDISSYNPKVKTYIIFPLNTNVPNDINQARNVDDVVILNDITYNGGNKKVVCFYDVKKQKNISISNIGEVPRVKIKLQYLSDIKEDADPNAYALANFDKSTSSTLTKETNDIIAALAKKSTT